MTRKEQQTLRKHKETNKAINANKRALCLWLYFVTNKYACPREASS